MLAKKKNVKSCIIYEICIKEICNSIINKILIQFLEPVVQLRFFIVLTGSEDLVINGHITEIYKKQLVKVLSTSSGSPWPPVLPVQDILWDRPVWKNCLYTVAAWNNTWLQWFIETAFNSKNLNVYKTCNMQKRSDVPSSLVKIIIVKSWLDHWNREEIIYICRVWHAGSSEAQQCFELNANIS